MLLSLLPAPLLVAAPSIIPNLVSAPSRKLQQCPYGSDDDAYMLGIFRGSSWNLQANERCI